MSGPMFRSFSVANYRWWFAGALVSNTGTWMQRVAQDWLVLTELTDEDATAVGVTMALQFGPALVLLPITGLVADRVDRRRILLATQISMGMLAVGLAIVTFSGIVTLPMLYLFALGLGIAAAFDTPARQAFVAELVPANYLANAVALNSLTFNGARLGGPAVAGLLTAAVGPAWVFVINAVSFGAVCLALLAMRSSHFEASDRSPRRRGQMREGLDYIRARPDLVLVLVMMAIVGTIGFNFQIFTATMVRVEFGEGADVYGLLVSIVAIGSVVGALVAARRERPTLRVLVLACLGFAASLLLGAFAPTIGWYVPTLVLVGFTSLTIMQTANAYFQTSIEAQVRGRVMAIYMAVFMGGTPLGGPLLGAIADAFGPRAALTTGASAGLAAAAVAGVWWARRHGYHVELDRTKRWPIRVRPSATAQREIATNELAVVEVATQR